MQWLNKYLEPAITADEADRVLTASGFPIDGREDFKSTCGGDDDIVLEVEVTSNRCDCLSHVGVAREVAASTGRKFKSPLPMVDAASSQHDAALAAIIPIKNESPEACPLYTARLIRGVKVGASPAWLVRALESVGLRSVNNIVDVTNFVLMELGQPLHAFDLKKLSGSSIVVRHAHEGEVFNAIDASKHKLKNTGMLVIADAGKPVAIAGVMGGLESEVNFATTDVLLEAAVFDPASVRRTSRALKLASESSYRFERGVDRGGLLAASLRAAQLIVELAGGKLEHGPIVLGNASPARASVTLRIARCEQILGLVVPTERIVSLLWQLGLEPKLDLARGTVTCLVPTFRLDISREIDLIEEVGRMYGLDHIQVHDKMPIVVRPPQPAIVARQRLAQVLVAHGYHETVTHSFLSRAHGDAFVPAEGTPLLIEDERRKGEPLLRPSLLPSLLRVVKSNHDVGNKHLKLFEVGAVWHRKGDRIAEDRHLAMLMELPEKSDELALRDVRGTLEECVEQLAGSGLFEVLPVTNKLFSTAGEIRFRGKSIGQLGLLNKTVLEALDVKCHLVAAQLQIEPLLEAYPPIRLAGDLPRFPGIERDLSVLVAENIAWHRIEEIVLATLAGLHSQGLSGVMEELQFLGIYRGKPIAAGTKSVSFRMFFRDHSATLRREQVEPQVQAIIDALKQKLDAQLRT